MYSNKTKKNQIPYGIIILVLSIIFSLFLYSKWSILSFFWITGIAFGFILQKSKFCFTAAFRDPYLIGGTSLSKALLISIAITTIGFTAIKYNSYIKGQEIPGQEYIVNVSFAIVVGGILFGIGMVLAGGCASGILMRTGEGFQTQMVALIFFVIGSLQGAHDFKWWDEKFISKGAKIFLPDIFGWFGGLTIQLLIIAILYIFLNKWEERKSQEYENE